MRIDHATSKRIQPLHVPQIRNGVVVLPPALLSAMAMLAPEDQCARAASVDASTLVQKALQGREQIVALQVLQEPKGTTTRNRDNVGVAQAEIGPFKAKCNRWKLAKSRE